jgi:pimeloyl-ACP methyl ester carboxylesterase
MKRRELLISSALAACGAPTARAAPKCAAPRRTFLLVHGAWHSAMHWNNLAVLLSALGHRVVAVDLPGNGLTARYPKSYATRDQTGLSTERSKIACIGLEDYVDTIVPLLTSLSTAGGRVTLVGHSFGGMTITLAAERVPDMIHRLVYLSAFCPALLPGGSVNDYSALPENGRSLAGSVIIGDPVQVGAFRINPRSTDSAYIERGRQAFYADLSPEEFSGYAAYLSPDLPVRAAQGNGRGTANRWGKVPRTYIRCRLDRAIPIELQDRMIREADEMTPWNRFSVETLESSHSPFASMPQALAHLLSNMS